MHKRQIGEHLYLKPTVCVVGTSSDFSSIHFFQNYAQTLVDADRTSLFLVDNRTNELYARIFDIGGSLEDSRSSNLQKEIRYHLSRPFDVVLRKCLSLTISPLNSNTYDLLCSPQRFFLMVGLIVKS